MKQEVTLALALQRIAELEAKREEDNARHEAKHLENAHEIQKLKGWKETCTRWGAWWAGVCAAVMTLAALLRAYWDEIERFVKVLRGPQ